ncbi:MAG: DUF58 domain-containing protein [Staphylothermus sp.]|nr:DUF58 domain-containing protein [Staphylothermus sp.]
MQDVSATPNVVIIILILSLLAGIDIVLNKTITIHTLIIMSIGFSLILATRILVELSSRQIYRLRIKRKILDPAIENEPIRIKITIENKANIPLLKATLNDIYPGIFKKIKGYSRITTFILPGEKIEFIYMVKPVIGIHEFKGIEVIVSDPLNLFNYKTIINPERRVIMVKPRPLSMPKKLPLIYTQRGLGTGKARIKGIGQEFWDLREYNPGDDYRFIDWKSYARLRKLYVKEFEREANLSIIFIINATMESMRGILGETPLEYMVRLVAGLSNVLIKRGDWVGVVIRSDKVLRSGYGRGISHFYRIINTLSMIKWGKYQPVQTLEETILRETILLPRRTKTLFFILTSSLEPSEIDEIVRAYHKLLIHNHLMYIVYLVPELFEKKALKGLDAGIYSALIFDKLEKTIDINKLLSKRGIKTVSVGPDDIYTSVYGLIEKYRAVIT